LARIPLLKALPYLNICRCCLRKPKKDFRLALKKSLLKKMDMKMPKTDMKLEEDPFLRLGRLILIILTHQFLKMLIFLSFRFRYECLLWYFEILDGTHALTVRILLTLCFYLFIKLSPCKLINGIHHKILSWKHGYLYF